MSLSTLPQISFCETDTDKIREAAFILHESITGRKLYPGDPERLFLEALLYIIVQQRQAIDYTGKMNLLGYAVEDFLDHLGAWTETERLDPVAATTTVRFSMVGLRPAPVPIAVGKRVTPDGALMFATTAYAEIAVGQTYVDVAVQCATPGAAGNGFVAGQINQLVDPIDYVSTVSNTTTSAGGSDPEQDAAYRERIRLSPEKFSTAGPEGAYIFWATTAHPDIVDVQAYMPAAGQVAVHPLMAGGVLPSQAVLDAVATVLSPRTRRPLTDQVLVSAPSAVAYAITFTYYVPAADEANLSTIQANVDVAVAEYRAWQRARLGRDINPDELSYRLKAAGVKRAVITAPVFTLIDRDEVAQEGAVTVTYGGLEDE